MCNWSEAVMEEAYNNGFGSGFDNGTKSVIENALKAGRTPEAIADFINIDINEVLSVQEEMLSEAIK